jgi:HAD superfamily hydrolase (TIGR01484 family)
MKNKAIVFDIDGTAIDSPVQKMPSEKLIRVIEKLQDKYFICSATGRVWSFAKTVLQAMNLSDPCIISAGTQICDPKSGTILWQKNLPRKALDLAIKIFQQYPEYKLLFNDCTEDDYLNGGILPKDFSTDLPVYFLEQKFIPEEIAGEIYEKLSHIENAICVMVVAQKPGMKDLHVINKETTKEHAIAELLKIINVKKENTIGAGDGHNDFHLFNAVGHKIAVGNAVPDLKKLADEVIGSVKEDGFAKYLETLN